MLPATKKASTSRLNSSTSQTPDGSIKVGYVRRAHGIKGAVIVRVLDDEHEQFAPGRQLATDRAGHPTLAVRSAHPHRDGLLVRFDGIDDRNEAETLRGTSLLVTADERRELDDGEFWPEQLIGLRVLDPEGHNIGEIAALEPGGAQDRLIITTAGGTFAVPFVDAIVTNVDLADGCVVVDAPVGLLGD